MIPGKLKEKLENLSIPFYPKVFRAHLIALVAAAVVIPLGILAVPYLEIFNDMAVQPKGKTQSLYGSSQGESLIVQRKPVLGTLPMGYHPYRLISKDEETAKLAEATLANPLHPTMEILESGRHSYEIFCITCHGPRGEGNGPIVGSFPAPPSLHTETARGFKDGRIFHVISRGQNAMPSYADVLGRDERWAAVHFVRALQRAQNPKPEDLDQ